jgi:hypothetical protein
MILPPLYGASTKSDDNSWEALRLSQLSTDAMKYTAQNPLLKITELNFDIFKYINPTDTRIFNTQFNLDCIKYKKPEFIIECSNIAIDVLKQKPPETTLLLSNFSIDILRY